MIEDPTLRAAMREVFHGGGTPAQRTLVNTYLSERQIATAEEMLRNLPRPRLPRTRQLSPAETEVLDLIAQGFTAEAAGAQLYKSGATVKQQLSSAYRKLGARNAPHAVALYLRPGGHR